MKLILERQYIKDSYTIGKLYIDYRYFCDTLEDKVRDLNKDGDLRDEGESKVYGKTAIPYGIYEVEVTYSSKFKRVLPLVKNVEHFDGIRFHRGNKPEHSEGCILVGENKIKGGLINSTKYEVELTEILSFAQNRFESIILEII